MLTLWWLYAGRACAFEAVLMYLHGEGLHMPTELCPAAWHDELVFYGLQTDTPAGCKQCDEEVRMQPLLLSCN